MPDWMMTTLAALLLAQHQTPPGPGLTDSQAQFNACAQQAGGNDPDIRECFRLYNVREDARLNDNWRALMEVVGGPDTSIGAELRTEQRAWIAFKEQSCRHFTIEGGTQGALRSSICLGAIIRHRADELDEMRQYYINR